MKARHEFHDDNDYREYLKIYFAAMAMQGLLANPDFLIQKGASTNSLAFKAIETADKLLTQLLKQLES